MKMPLEYLHQPQLLFERVQKRENIVQHSSILAAL